MQQLAAAIVRIGSCGCVHSRYRYLTNYCFVRIMVSRLQILFLIRLALATIVFIALSIDYLLADGVTEILVVFLEVQVYQLLAIKKSCLSTLVHFA